MQILKQSTSVKVVVGPLVDAGDAVTAASGVTLGGADLAEIVKHDEASVTDISLNAFAHISNGLYNLTLSTTDTNTPGMLSVVIANAGICRPYRADYMVIPENDYDSLIAGTDTLEVDVTRISGDAMAADNLEAGASALVRGVVATGSSVTAVVTSLAEDTNDHYNGRTIVFTSGTLQGQAATISGYNGATKTLTVSTMTGAASDGDTFVLV